MFVSKNEVLIARGSIVKPVFEKVVCDEKPFMCCWFVFHMMIIYTRADVYDAA